MSLMQDDFYVDAYLKLLGFVKPRSKKRDSYGEGCILNDRWVVNLRVPSGENLLELESLQEMYKTIAQGAAMDLLKDLTKKEKKCTKTS